MSKTETKALAEGAFLLGNKGKHRYEIIKYLGRGGFGITYLAQETVPVDGIPQQHKYTIKEFCLSDICTRQEDNSLTVGPGMTGDFNEAKGEFRKEAEHLHELSNPGIVPVSEVFEQNGTVYYVMQYLGDTTLAGLMKQQGGSLDEELAVDIIRKVSASLRYLHQHMMTHLDVKPENIMLLKDSGGWTPVLIDFGLSCHYGKNGTLTSKDVAPGTSKGYSPMEQYVPGGVKTFTPQADIYALGATLFCLLTGKEPVISAEVSNKYLYSNLPEGVSERTANAVVKAMQKNKEDRPANIDEFLKLLGDADTAGPITGGNVTERIPKRKTGGGKFELDSKYLYAVLAAVVLVIGLYLFYPSTSGCSSGTEPSADVQEEVMDPHSEVQTNASAGHEGETPAQVNTQQTSSPASETPASNNHATNTAGNASGGSSAGSSAPTTPTATPSESEGHVKDLGYAVWYGPVRKGKPDGGGKMVFKRAHVIDSFDPDENEAQSGDYVEGIYLDGHLVSGKWYDASGNKKKTIYIGGL